MGRGTGVMVSGVSTEERVGGGTIAHAWSLWRDVSILEAGCGWGKTHNFLDMWDYAVGLDAAVVLE